MACHRHGAVRLQQALGLFTYDFFLLKYLGWVAWSSWFADRDSKGRRRPARLHAYLRESSYRAGPRLGFRPGQGRVRNVFPRTWSLEMRTAGTPIRFRWPLHARPASLRAAVETVVFDKAFRERDNARFT